MNTKRYGVALATTVAAVALGLAGSQAAHARQGLTTGASGSEGGGGVVVQVNSTSVDPGTPGGGITVFHNGQPEYCSMIWAEGGYDGSVYGTWVVEECATGAGVPGVPFRVFAPASPQNHRSSVPPVNPAQVAQSAAARISLPDPLISTDPSPAAVVNLPTWLWVSPSEWRPYSATAAVQGVSATATATPESVTWSMGDGGSVTCGGPGSPYDPSLPASSQSPSCSYTYRTTSAGQPGTGASGAGAFRVTATIAWSVSWSASGASGGGKLASLTTSSSVALPVEQIESVVAQ